MLFASLPIRRGKDDVTGIGVIDDIAIPVIVVGAVAHDLYTNGIADKMAREIDRIYQRAKGPNGFTYELRVKQPGTYIDVRGLPVTLKANDIWKYGETTSTRYSASELSRMVSGGVYQIPIYYGNQIEIKVFEKYLIYGHFLNHQSLPPGNRIFR